jgi:hypothetical protein
MIRSIKKTDLWLFIIPIARTSGRVENRLYYLIPYDMETDQVIKYSNEKSNEIIAIPEVIKQLELQNTIVSIDAMGCQTAIAK